MGGGRRRREAGASMAWAPRHEGARALGAGARVGCGWGRGRARARVLPVKTPPWTSLSLLPQPPSSASTDAPQPMFFRHLDAVMGSVRSRGRGFSRRAGCPLDVSRLLLASAAPAGPRYGRQDTLFGELQGAAQAGRRFPTSAAATVCWEEVLWLLPRLERALTAPLQAS